MLQPATTHRLVFASADLPDLSGGLLGNYYDNGDFTELRATRVDPQIGFDWGEDLPAPNLTPETYSVKWGGYLEAGFSETYHFEVRTQGGVRLWVGDELLINDWDNTADTAFSSKTTLVAGQKYPIRVQYREVDGGDGIGRLKVLWSSQSQAQEIMPQSKLSPAELPDLSVGGLVATYYDDAEFIDLRATRIDPKLDFDWTEATPNADIEPETYSVKWSGISNPSIPRNTHCASEHVRPCRRHAHQRLF